MSVVKDKVTCENCKHSLKKHQRFYTYDNREVDFYEWYCMKGKQGKPHMDKQKECVAWEAPNQ
ncbi:MAG: hypothetical protein ACRDDX_15300 [Cellulosilyticaceae bacterium]